MSIHRLYRATVGGDTRSHPARAGGGAWAWPAAWPPSAPTRATAAVPPSRSPTSPRDPTAPRSADSRTSGARRPAPRSAGPTPLVRRTRRARSERWNGVGQAPETLAAAIRRTGYTNHWRSIGVGRRSWLFFNGFTGG